MKKENITNKYSEMADKLKNSLKLKNTMQAPKLDKVVLNIGLGRKSQQGNFEDKLLPEIIKDLSAITGQAPIVTKAKKSISGFKVREGQIIGLKVTLRKQRMYDFLERLNNIVFPRLRDFKGIPLKSVDSNGNLSIGLKEQVVFPEINSETINVDFGMEISIVSNAKKRDDAIALYKEIGIPFKKN